MSASPRHIVCHAPVFLPKVKAASPMVPNRMEAMSALALGRAKSGIEIQDSAVSAYSFKFVSLELGKAETALETAVHSRFVFNPGRIFVGFLSIFLNCIFVQFN